MQSRATKIFQLLSLIPRRPVELYDRFRNVLEYKLDSLLCETPKYNSAAWNEVICDLEECFGEKLTNYETPLQSIEEYVRNRIEAIKTDSPFALSHNADFTLARLTYLLCRVTKPETVMETGVAFGVTSAFLLKALEINGRGDLHSVDLPPLTANADSFVGILIPENLKKRWHLYRGISRRIFPWLLPTLPKIDMFVHDSLHTYRTMSWEFDVVSQHLGDRAVVVSDDIEENSAFQEWVMRMKPNYSSVLKEEEKKALLGIGVFSPES